MTLTVTQGHWQQNLSIDHYYRQKCSVQTGQYLTMQFLLLAVLFVALYCIIYIVLYCILLYVTLLLRRIK